MKVFSSPNLTRSGGRRLESSAIFICYLLIIWIVEPVFFSPANLGSVLYSTCLLLPAVLTAHLLLVLGLFDLSTGAVAAAASVASAKAIYSGCPILIAVALAVAIGALFGLLNSLLINRIQVAALIATLITMGIARAVALGISDGRIIGGLNSRYGLITSVSVGGISLVVIAGILSMLLLAFLEQAHVVLRRFYQVGSNREAALSTGIRVARIETLGFALAGAGAAVSGVLQSSRTASASPLIFPDLALECIAACVIGGTSLTGGIGGATGAFFGMLVIVISRNLAVLTGVNIYWKDLAISAMLLAAVLINRNRGRRGHVDS